MSISSNTWPKNKRSLYKSQQSYDQQRQPCNSIHQGCGAKRCAHVGLPLMSPAVGGKSQTYSSCQQGFNTLSSRAILISSTSCVTLLITSSRKHNYLTYKFTGKAVFSGNLKVSVKSIQFQCLIILKGTSYIPDCCVSGSCSVKGVTHTSEKRLLEGQSNLMDYFI